MATKTVTQSSANARAGSPTYETARILNQLRAALLAGPIVSAAPTLAIGTTSKKEVKHGAFNIVVQGKVVAVAAGEVAFTATTHDIADPDADPREALYLLSCDDGGTVAITKGTTAAADAATAPAAPAEEVVFGSVLIQHDGTAVFDATTDDLDAAHLTVTYTDLGQTVDVLSFRSTGTP